MIRILHASRLSRQPFFQDLIHYLHTHRDTTLRQIKATFSDEPGLDRKLDQYIQAGYIVRDNRRYHLGVSFLESLSHLSLDEEYFVDTASPVFQDLQTYYVPWQLTNPANKVIIEEQVDILRERLTLESYFYKMRTQEALTAEQQPLYALLGDVNPDYALKYLTTFLLKFTRKELVKQRRPDVFVETLRILGFIEQVEEQSYRLTMDLDRENLLFKSRKKDEF